MVGAFARLSPEKGLDVLLDAAALLTKKGIDLRIVLAGDGPERSSLEHQAAKLRIDDYVEFRGDIAHERVAEVLAELDIFAMPSREEGFGVAALEAEGMAVTVVHKETPGGSEAVFTDEGLAPFDAILVFQANGDPWNASEKAALERWQAAGNGIAAVHNALDMRGNYPWWDNMVGSLMPGSV